MKRTISLTLAFAAALLCSGPFAASPSNAQLSGLNGDEVFSATPVDNVQEAKIAELTSRWKETSPDGDSRKAIRVKLAEELLRQFVLLEEKRMQKVEAIEKRIQSVKAILQQRAQNAERIVDLRISELLGEPSSMSWDFPVDLPNPDGLNSSGGTALDPLAKPILLEHGERMNPDLLLGYGLAESNIQAKKSELAQSASELAEYEKVAADARAACLDLSRKLKGQNMNDPQLSSEYQKSIDTLLEALRKVDDVSATIQSKKREIETLELQLLPLSNEVENHYPDPRR